MYQDGNTFQYRLTKTGEPTDKERGGIMMEVYKLWDTRMARGLKGCSMSCNQMALTQSSMSSMRTEKR